MNGSETGGSSLDFRAALEDALAGLELSHEQFLVLKAFGYDPRLLSVSEMEAAIEEVIALARAELDRDWRGPYWDVPNPSEVLEAFGRTLTPEPMEVLAAILGYRPNGLTDSEVQRRLDEEVARARRELARVSVGKEAVGGVRGGGSGGAHRSSRFLCTMRRRPQEPSEL